MLYLDHASTTPTDPRVVKKMLPFFSDNFGNPSSIYRQGRKANQAVVNSRTQIGKFLNCDPEEVIFTSGGTESDNLAILGIARKAGQGHIITSQIEHSAVLNSCKQLEKEGFKVTYLPVSKEGIVDPDDVKKAIRKDTILVSIMYANNEIGTIQPIAEISEIIHEFNSKLPTPDTRLFFHTDACQAAGYLNMDVEALGVDLLTFNGSKIYGPKGVGVLYVKNGIKIQPIIFGGHQENSTRPGTENVPAIVGLAEAVRLISKYNHKDEIKIRDYFIEKLLEIKDTELNGDKLKRLPNNVNIYFKDVEGESAVLYLDKEGLACSTGSACLSKTLEPSHVILALGKSKEVAHCSLRLTHGRETTIKQIDEAVLKIKKVVSKLREMSVENG